MRFQWRPTLLLEWDSNLANSCSIIEKNEISEMYILANFQFFRYFFVGGSVARKKIYIDTNNNSHQIVQ